MTSGTCLFMKKASCVAPGDGAEASLGRSERPVPLLSPQEIMKLEDDEVIIYCANKAPIRTHRMDIRRFPKLEARMPKVAPAVPNLPPLQEVVLAPLPQKTSGFQEREVEHQAEFVNPEHFVP